MTSFIDEEFGEITLRRSTRATHIKIRVAPNGRLRASSPMYAPLFMVKRLVKSSRSELRSLLEQHQQGSLYIDGMQIGKSHSLSVRSSQTESTQVTRHGLMIIVSLPEKKLLSDSAVQRQVRDEVINALHA